MAATNNKLEYRASSALTLGVASLASSSTLVAGRSSAEYDNTTNKDFDAWLASKITAGTSPTANTVIEGWIIPKKNDTTYHDTFDGTDKAVTVTSRQHLQAYGYLAFVIEVPATTSNVAYEASRSVADAVRAWMPAKFQLFITHNMGAAANATSGNHVTDIKGSYSSSGN
jgi:hypothetical protein